MRNTKLTLALASWAIVMGMTAAPRAGAQKKEYLTARESDEVRDSETPSDRIKLFIGFAGDRIRKLQYEFQHPDDNTHPVDRINAMIDNFADCIDDAADLIDEGTEKQQDIRPAIKEMQARGPEFLSYLKSLKDQGSKMDDYEDNLDDAIDAVNDAMTTANDATKELAPAPARRKPANQ